MASLAFEDRSASAEERALSEERRHLLSSPASPRPAYDGRQEVELRLLSGSVSTAAADALARARARPPRWFGSLGEELYGYALMALSSVAFGTMTLVVHLLGSPFVGYSIPSVVIVWARSLVQLAAATLCIVSFVDYAALIEEMSPSLTGWLALRGLVGSLGMICLFTSLSLLPLGDAITLFFLGPVITMLGTHLILKEPVSTLEGVSAIVAFCGVALVAHGRDTAVVANTSQLHPTPLPMMPVPLLSFSGAGAHGIGVLVALIGALLSAGALTIVRKMNTSVHFMFSVFSFGVMSSLITSVALRGSVLKVLLSLASRPVPAVLLIFQGLAGFAGQCALNKGLQHCRGVGVLIRNIDVPISYLLGVMFFHEVPSFQSLFGSTLIISAVAAIAMRHILRPQP